MLAALTLIFGAAYTLWLVKRVVFGAVTNEQVAKLKDLSLREAAVLGTLAVFTLGLGIYPKPLTDVMQPAVQKMVLHLNQTKTL
jgi:NADH-quinone oxidoreductase subunit M